MVKGKALRRLELRLPLHLMSIGLKLQDTQAILLSASLANNTEGGMVDLRINRDSEAVVMNVEGICQSLVNSKPHCLLCDLTNLNEPRDQKWEATIAHQLTTTSRSCSKENETSSSKPQDIGPQVTLKGEKLKSAQTQITRKSQRRQRKRNKECNKDKSGVGEEPLDEEPMAEASSAENLNSLIPVGVTDWGAQNIPSLEKPPSLSQPSKPKVGRGRRVVKIKELGIDMSQTDINLLLKPRRPLNKKLINKPTQSVACPSCHEAINVRNKKRASGLVIEHVTLHHAQSPDKQKILHSFEKALYHMSFRFNHPKDSDPPPLVCPICSEQRAGTICFDRHMTLCHGDHDNMSALCEQTKKQHQLEQWKSKYTLQKSKVKSCQFCSKKYDTYTSLKYHIQHVCTANPDRRKRSESKPYICETCGKGFIAGRYLYLHQVTKHDKTNAKKFPRDYKVYSCHVCNQKFLSQFKLNRHLASHTGEKFFQCELCGKQFRDDGNRKRHLVTVHGEMNFSEGSKSLDAGALSDKGNAPGSVNEHMLNGLLTNDTLVPELQKTQAGTDAQHPTLTAAGTGVQLTSAPAQIQGVNQVQAFPSTSHLSTPQVPSQAFKAVPSLECAHGPNSVNRNAEGTTSAVPPSYPLYNNQGPHLPCTVAQDPTMSPHLVSGAGPTHSPLLPTQQAASAVNVRAHTADAKALGVPVGRGRGCLEEVYSYYCSQCGVTGQGEIFAHTHRCDPLRARILQQQQHQQPQQQHQHQQQQHQQQQQQHQQPHHHQQQQQQQQQQHQQLQQHQSQPYGHSHI